MQKTILIADDDRNIVNLLKIKLVTMGYKIITAYEGKTALKLLEHQKPDLAILDIMMPSIDGFTLELETVDDGALGNTKVIMMTGKPELKELFDKTRNTKVNAWFNKPLDLDRVATTVEILLKEKQNTGS